jgi:signal transduction histidine kinase/ligand-binding sensor domain-containing protein
VVRRSIDQLTRRRYTAEDGLPANNVQAVVQSPDGYLWIGTDMGLARFDGQRFRSFTENNTAALAEVGDDILSLVEAPDGTLWAAAYGGLLRIRGTEFTGYTAGLPERFLLQVAPAEDGAVWIAGFLLNREYRGPCRVRRFHPDTGQTSAEISVPGHVRRLVPTPDGVWLATEEPEQLLFWDMKSLAPAVMAKFSGQPWKVGLRASEVVPGGVRMRGWKDPQDPLKQFVEIGVGRHELTFHWLTRSFRNRISASRWVPFQNPDSWIGAEPGLARIRDDRLEQIHFDEQTQWPEITCLSPNREGGVWVGIYSDGLQLIRERLVQVFTTRDGLSGNDIRSVVATREGTVLAGGPAGLDELRGGHWTPRGTNTPTPLSKLISIAQDAFGTVWIGLGHTGWTPLQYLAGESPLALGPSPFDWAHPSSLAVTPEGRLWVGCDRGLTSLDLPGAAPSSEFPAAHADWMNQIVYKRLESGGALPRTELLKLIPDQDGSLWIGTYGHGLLRLKDDQVESFTAEDGLPNICSPAHLDETGALWVVANGAVARLHNGHFRSLGLRDGIPDDQFLDLIADDLGHFWLPGLRGIHQLEKSQLEACFEGRLDRVQSLTLGLRDGLLTPDCTSMHYPITAKTHDGRIWVATRNGVASFDPSRIAVDIQPLTVSIEQVVANREPIDDPIVSPAAPPLKLRPGSGDRLEFHYTATSLVAADRVRFQHRLEGYDSDWSPESDLRLAFYTNLRPGRYQFHVKASNAYGTWNDVATTLPFVIAPHFWQTWFFQGSMGFLVLTLAILLHRQRLGVLRYLHELKTHQQLAAERTRIAADMHDDLGAALSHIAILSEVAKSQSPAQPQTRSALDRISQSARDVTARMSDLVWATNPRNDTLENLAAYLREQAARQLENTPVRAILDFPDRLPQCHVSATFRRNILLVVKETLNNSMKHAAATEFRIKLGMESGHLLLCMEDNGRGFDPVTRSAVGNGLTNLRRRIQDLGGTLNIEAAPDAGTKVHVRVPLPLDLPRVQ